MEGLSLLINEAKILGKINGISFSTTLVITHLLFVDDVAIFGLGTLEEWACFRGILDILTAASCMVISVDKSSFLYNNISSIVLDSIQVLFPYKMHQIDTGCRYLGYPVKPLNYQVRDWRWVIRKFEHKLSNWSFIFLSMGGCLILLNFVLCGIQVYWFSLVKLPNTILKAIRTIMFSFMWWGHNSRRGLHLVNWE